MAADHSAARQKKTWKTAMFRLGSCQQTTIRPLALGAHGRLQRQLERITREPRLKGCTPLGTFRRRSTVHQIEVGWRELKNSWTLKRRVIDS